MGSFLVVNSLNHQLEKLPFPLGHGIDPFGLGRAGHARSEVILAVQRHGPPSESDGVQEGVVVDLAQTGTAVLVGGREIAVD